MHISQDIPSRLSSQATTSQPHPTSPRITAAGTSTGVEPDMSGTDGAQDTTTRRAPSTSVDGALDVEDQTGPHYASEADPYQLSTRLKSPDDIRSIRTGISRRNSLVGQLHLAKDATKAKRVGDFYEGQNENIERLLKTVDQHRQEAKESSDVNAFHYKAAVYGSLAANLVLAVLQVYGATASGSLSLFTTMADALFDPVSNITLLLCHRTINKSMNPRKWPQGKARIETAGNITFCFIMCAVSLVLLVISAQEIETGPKERKQDLQLCQYKKANEPLMVCEYEQTTPFHLPSIIVVSVAIVFKLFLFGYCWSLRNRFSQIRILWEDHRNDIIINGVGLFTSIMGSKIEWYIDPIGAIILSLIIMTLWLRTAWSEFQLLIGVTADTGMLQHLTYICTFPPSHLFLLYNYIANANTAMTHSPDIVALDTVRAWYSGPRLIVEVDVVMRADESLRDTHDVAEALQTKLESLPNVDRAYVHVDYETSHAPEHFLKKEL